MLPEIRAPASEPVLDPEWGLNCRMRGRRKRRAATARAVMKSPSTRLHVVSAVSGVGLVSSLAAAYAGSVSRSVEIRPCPFARPESATPPRRTSLPRRRTTVVCAAQPCGTGLARPAGDRAGCLWVA
jgi:hypothetical protein